MAADGVRVSAPPLPACDRPCDYCTHSSRQRDSPKKNVRRANEASRDPASAPTREEHARRTGMYSGHAAKYFFAKERGSAAECAGKSANELPTAQKRIANWNVLPRLCSPPPAPRL